MDTRHPDVDDARLPRPIVGLTGGIGSGKTTVADAFAELGATVVDTDVIAHALTMPQGEAMAAITAAFGPSVVRLDGALDRAAMRRLCFADEGARRRLEAILHPLIRDESWRQCRQATAAPYVLLVVPLLLESGAYRAQIDRLLVVDCPEEQQVARVMARSGLAEDEVRRIVAAQASRQERLAAADDVIDNTVSLGELRARVLHLHELYMQRYRDREDFAVT